MKLHIETTKTSSDNKRENIIFRVDVKDNLNFKNAEKFKYIISALINGGVKKIIIDINELNEIDSMGIGTFITLNKSLADKDIDLIITRGNNHVLSLFKPIKLEQIIRLFPTIDDGIKYLSSLK